MANGSQIDLSRIASFCVSRCRTLEAVSALAVARSLVRFVRLGRWQHWLGSLVPENAPENAPENGGAGDDSLITARQQNAKPADLRLARSLARHVQRATELLPGASKCLPQAIALQWLLRRRAMPSRLVIAGLLPPFNPDEDRFHAWIELGEGRGGEMVIGACEPTRYTRIMEIVQPPLSPAK